MSAAACLVMMIRLTECLLAMAEEYATKQSPQRIEELVKIFVHATKVRGSSVHGPMIFC